MIMIDKISLISEDLECFDFRILISDDNDNKAELSKKDLEDLLSDTYRYAIEEAFFKKFGGKK